MQRSFDVSAPVELEVRLSSGEVTIDPSLDGRVEVELTAHDDDSQRLVDEARVELQDRSDRPRVIVEVPQKRGGFSFSFGRQGITCRVRCPEGSVVTAKTKSADLTVRGTIGSVSFTTASGDLDLDRVSGGVNAKSASGDVSAREIGGDVSIQSASGDVSLEVVRGAASVTSVSGDVRIDEAYDDLNANTVSGD
jgi:DUF4097 and DUF4098 domain-containing protein YvlB